MYRKAFSMMAGGLVTLAWMLGSGSTASAADQRDATAVSVQPAVATNDAGSARIQLVDRRWRRGWNDGWGVSIGVGVPGSYYDPYPYGYYYYDHPRYYPRNRYY